MTKKEEGLPTLLLMNAMVSSVKLKGGKEVVAQVTLVVPAGEEYEAVAGLLAHLIAGDAVADVQLNVTAMQSRMA